jgi:hypothetical protein
MEKRPFDFLLDAADSSRARNSTDVLNLKHHLEEDTFELDLQYKQPPVVSYQKSIAKQAFSLDNRRVFCRTWMIQLRKVLILQRLKDAILTEGLPEMGLSAKNRQRLASLLRIELD